MKRVWRQSTMLLPAATFVCIEGCAMFAPPGPAVAAGQRLQAAIDRAEASAVVQVAPGQYSAPLTIAKPLTLRGSDRSKCIIELRSNEPAVHLRKARNIVIENLTVRYAIRSRKAGPKVPAGILVEDAEAIVRNCRIEALADPKKAPTAVFVKGRSNLRFEGGKCEGFNYTVVFAEGTTGEVADSEFHNAGHCGITLHRDARVKIARNAITGSAYHGVRSTGGYIELVNNVLASNRRSGAYLGNKNAHGTMRNNLFIGNAEGIASFYRSDVTVAHNLFIGAKYSGVGAWDSCPLAIRRNSFVDNTAAISRYVGKTRLSPVPLALAGNHYHGNGKDTVECEKSSNAKTGAPQFVDADHGNFALKPGSPLLGVDGKPVAGLADAEAIRAVWARVWGLAAVRI